MRKFLLSCAAIGALSLLGACSSNGTLDPAAQAVVSVACNVDALAQPVMLALAPELAPELAPLAAGDAALVHPAVAAACKAVNGTPASVTVSSGAVPTVTPTPPAPVVAPAPAAVPATSGA